MTYNKKDILLFAAGLGVGIFGNVIAQYLYDFVRYCEDGTKCPILAWDKPLITSFAICALLAAIFLVGVTLSAMSKRKYD